VRAGGLQELHVLPIALGVTPAHWRQSLDALIANAAGAAAPQ
jgi:hypothetical protein